MKKQVISSVVYIEKQGATASGLYVQYKDYHCILTNNHVLPNKGAAAISEVFFDYEVGQSASNAIQLDPEGFFSTDESLDFALCKIKDGRRVNGRKPIPFNEEGRIGVGEDVIIISHPVSGPKMKTTGKVK